MTPTAFGRYLVQGEIGDGAMGRVYRGLDPRFGRAVAIKTIKSEYLTRGTRSEYLRRFRREARAAGRLSHPSIVRVYDVGEDYIVMEFVEGVTLHALLKERSLALPEALDLLSPLADALDYAHGAGVLHRDVKPVNIMVQPDGQPKLMDFGIARVDTAVITVPGSLLGSPAYLAPELIRGEEATSQADLFSFAVVAYETLTGRRPFLGDAIGAVLYRVVYERAAAPSSWKPYLPEGCDAVFRRALAKSPERRFPSARAFIGALKNEGRVRLHSTTLDPEPRRLSSIDTQPLPHVHLGASWRAWLISAAGALALGATAVMLLRQGRGELGDHLHPGTLRIQTKPPGAAVWLDGNQVGKTPMSLPNLHPGRRQLRVQEDGYAPAELSLELAEGSSLPPLEFVMLPTAAPLTVRSEPVGARVRLDGRIIGATPVGGLLLSPGWHEVRVDQPGFLTKVQRLEARAGQALLVGVHLERRVEPPRVAVLPAAMGRAKAGTPVPPPLPATRPPLAEGALVAIDGSVKPPTRISGGPAPYPDKARKQKLGGSVLLEMIVTEKGEATEIHVVESAGTVLDDAVVQSVRGWRFEPARKDGIKVRVRWQCRQTFQLG